MNQPIIITGMHRSGTSLVASILQQAGINIGDKLIGDSVGNPRGHFEDVDFYQFQQNILKRLGQTIMVQQPLDPSCITPQEIASAKQLIATRAHIPVWGWKDPRTCLFLDFWHTLLPQAKTIFIYRHPIEVLLSLLRRGKDLEALVDPLAGLQAWQVYNQAILNFYQQYPTNCFLTNIATVVANIEEFIKAVNQKFNLTLQTEKIAALYQATELKQIAIPADAINILKQIAPESVAIYEQLEHVGQPKGCPEIYATHPQTQLTSWDSILLENPPNNPPNEVTASAWLTLLLATLDPPHMAMLRKNIQHGFAELRQKEYWLEGQYQAQKTRIVELESWIAELEKGKNWLEMKYYEQLSWIAELEKSKNWLEQQYQESKAKLEAPQSFTLDSKRTDKRD